VLREVEYAREAVYELSGTGNQIVIPALMAFLKEHPTLSAEIMVRPEPLDLRRAGVDLAIRAGDRNEKGFRQTSVECRTLAPLRYVVCAARYYFRRDGTPAHPRALAEQKDDGHG
jgi:DNA-binding transcriptional LysR family regulator